VKDVKEQFKHQMTCNGFHRIVAPDGTAGALVPYTSLAMLSWHERTFVAGSQYGLLPKAETVYELTNKATKGEHTPKAVCEEKHGECLEDWG